MAGTPTQIQLRRDTASNWALSNPVLALGELGVDITNNILFIGDGVSTQSNLYGMPYTPRTLNATSAGSYWYACPAVLGATFTLTAGATTVVLVEVMNKDGVTVSTAATITLDTVSQVIPITMQMRDTLAYRFRVSSGTGTVSIYMEK